MTNRDPAIDLLGITVDVADDGSVTTMLTVTEAMTNSHGVCHGGITFLLADAVMDYATNNATADGTTAFAAHAEVDYVRAAHVGDTLTAKGGAVDTWGRTNLLDATITNQRGEVVTHFRGRTRTVTNRA